MRISTKCSIGLHCLIFIAEYGDRMKVTGELLARSTGCNPVMIRNILKDLRRAGLIRVARGVGGAHLDRTPEEVTVWDVYHALEGDGLEHLMGLHPNPSDRCPVGRGIASVLDGPYHEIGAAVRQAMERITLRRLLEDYRQIT